MPTLSREFEQNLDFLDGLVLGLRAAAKTTELSSQSVAYDIEDNTAVGMLRNAAEQLMDCADWLAEIRRARFECRAPVFSIRSK